MERIKLSKKEFKTLMEVIKCTSKEKVRPVLQCVNFNTNEVAGLDGYRLMIRKGNFELEGSYSVNNEFLKCVLKAITKDTEYIEITFENNKAIFNVDNSGEYACKINDYDFINYRQLIPNSFTVKIDMTSTTELKNILKDFKTKNIPVFTICNDNLKINSTFINEYEKVLPIKCKYKNELRIAFNPIYLKDCFKNYKECNIGLNSPVNPMVVTNEDKTKIDLILPIRLAK